MPQQIAEFEADSWYFTSHTRKNPGDKIHIQVLCH
ncbi:hypothetical protein NB231_09183 [Nitrococcus mobilis Nb-231]|uniref:Uncharacterized protein n=1 Tax=Nitrococcus mobilis Nb-231 TaxID=314278 RepID=A4BN14_9GAMM|nr:hypothetical protein NB231_09183 [Nitrococcus mobilis Nb-231]